jgi:hypothetical protein
MDGDPARFGLGQGRAGLVVRVWEEPGHDALFRAVLSLSGTSREEHLSAASLDALCELLLDRLTYLKSVASSDHAGGRRTAGTQASGAS